MHLQHSCDRIVLMEAEAEVLDSSRLMSDKGVVRFE